MPSATRPINSHDLPDGMFEWVAETAGGRVIRLDRHVARREAWVVDVERPDGSVLEGFLRLDRHRSPGKFGTLEKEKCIVAALADTAVPVPALYGWSGDLSGALFERVPGSGHIAESATADRRALMEDFVDAIAALHVLDIDELGLPEQMKRPATARECALNELETIITDWRAFLDTYTEPLLTYAVDWLRRFAPEQVSRVSLLQGDTGPGNFVHQGTRVSAVVDWECGHFGDPLEDLGNICVREFWTPSGCVDRALFERYEQASGIPVDLAAVRYYRVQQNMRGMIPIHAITQRPMPQEPLAWYLAYKYVGDRSTCDAIAESLGIALPEPKLPASDDPSGLGLLADAACYALEHDIAPAVEDPFARSRVSDAQVLVACVDRLRQFGGAVDDLERDELAALLGRRPTSTDEGLRQLDAGIREHRYADEDLVPYLAGRAQRLEWLYAPAAKSFANPHWAALD